MNRKEKKSKPGKYIVKESKEGELIFGEKQRDGTVKWEGTGLTKDEIKERLKISKLGESIIDGVKRELAGISENVNDVSIAVFQASQNDNNVLILGETGTGKEIVATEIHKHSKRKEKNFVIMQPAGLSGEHADAELFGVAKSAYSGVTEREGLIEAADKGTLFIDEIADLPPGVQAKLLRVLQGKKFRRIGEAKEERESDFRLICATNQDVGAPAIMPGQTGFRKDLYWRIATVEIRMSPLRERREDIMPIFLHLIQEHYPNVDIKKISMSWNSLYCLLMNNWFGNVRELENVVKRNPIKQRKLAKETAYFPFDVWEQLRRIRSFQHAQYDMSHPVTADWGDEQINLVTFAKIMEGKREPPYWKLREIGQLTSLSDSVCLEIEKVLVDEGRKLEALPKYEKQVREYHETQEERKLELEREQHRLSILETLSKFGPPGLSPYENALLGLQRSPQKSIPPLSVDSLDRLAEKGIPLEQVEKEYLKSFLHYHPIEQGKKGKSIRSRAETLGLSNQTLLARKLKKYSLSGSSNKTK